MFGSLVKIQSLFQNVYIEWIDAQAGPFENKIDLFYKLVTFIFVNLKSQLLDFLRYEDSSIWKIMMEQLQGAM